MFVLLLLLSFMCCDYVSLFCFFFFFQAEDGIRDWSVTGVQTCALPIYPYRLGVGGARLVEHGALDPPAPAVDDEGHRRGIGHARSFPRAGRARRSEERRVGKECRSRWSPYQQKKYQSKRRRDGKCKQIA